MQKAVSRAWHLSLACALDWRERCSVARRGVFRVFLKTDVAKTCLRLEPEKVPVASGARIAPD